MEKKHLSADSDKINELLNGKYSKYSDLDLSRYTGITRMAIYNIRHNRVPMSSISFRVANQLTETYDNLEKNYNIKDGKLDKE